MATGSRIEELVDMDLLSFTALAEVTTRIVARQKYESAWTAMYAAQGTKESMENLTKPWIKGSEHERGAEDLMRDLGISGGTGSV